MPQDFSGKNLRGRSFKGQDLTGANFSYADIRGADFTNATLRGANFSHAKAGLQRRWVIGLVLVSWLLSGVSGIFSALASYLVSLLFSDGYENLYSGAATLIVLIVFWIIAIRQSLVAGLGAVAVAGACGGVVAGGFAVIRAFAGAGVFPGAGLFARSVAVAVAFGGAGVGAVVVAVAVAVAVAFAVDGVFAVVGAVIVAVAITVAVANTVAGVFAFFVTVGVAFIFAIVFTVLSTYIGWLALKGEQKNAWVRSFAVTFATTGGTSFRGADLTDADFTQATLKNTDFRTANLTRTRFYESEKLDFARVSDTILADGAVLNLLVSGNGRNRSYIGANLKGANLKGASLKEANLKEADIIEATFQGACLESANLTLTQASGTDFTSAQMTGVCIEAWNIESTTKLDNVDCRFVYLLERPKPRTDDRERRPSSGEFKSGEFTKLFQEVLNTVDLIFRDGVDWKAFVAAFKKVQVANDDTELAIQSIENKGDGVVVVKVSVPHDANKEKIHTDFNQNYSLALKEVETRYKAQLQAKDEQIAIYREKSADMKEIVSLLANKSVNVQIENKAESKSMNNSNDSSRKIEIGSVGRDFNASGQALNLGDIDISGVVNNIINELPDAIQPDKPGIKELLKQLQAAIEADTNLTSKNKEKALKQVKALAEASQNPQQEEKQDLADTAITMLKGLFSGLPNAAKLVEEFNNLLPLIANCLGLSE